MRTFMFAFFSFLMLAAPLGAARAGTIGPLIDARALDAMGGDALVLDIRGAQVEDGRIPGAVSAPYGKWRGPQTNPGEVKTDAELTVLFKALGIQRDRPAVVVSQGHSVTDFGAAARVYWTLKSAGLTQIALLNGGMEAWKAAKLDLTAVPATPVPSTISVTLSDEWRATRADVLKIVNGEETARLVDARPEDFHAGKKKHRAASRAGTIPQAQYFTHSGWFRSGVTTLDPATVQSLAAEAGFGADDKLVSFCNTGHWAATNWFALSEVAGIDGVRLYAESVVDWSNAGLPMMNASAN